MLKDGKGQQQTCLGPHDRLLPHVAAWGGQRAARCAAREQSAIIAIVLRGCPMRIRAGALLCLLLVGAVRAGRTDRNESTATWLDVASSDFTTFRNSSLAKPGEGYSLQLSHASNDPVVAFREASNQSWVTVMVMSGGAGWKLLPRCRCSSASKRVQHISLQLTASDEPVVAFQEWTGSPPPRHPSSIVTLADACRACLCSHRVSPFVAWRRSKRHKLRRCRARVCHEVPQRPVDAAGQRDVGDLQ